MHCFFYWTTLPALLSPGPQNSTHSLGICVKGLSSLLCRAWCSPHVACNKQTELAVGPSIPSPDSEIRENRPGSLSFTRVPGTAPGM